MTDCIKDSHVPVLTDPTICGKSHLVLDLA